MLQSQILTSMIIGLTGGIGSGKSYIAEILKFLGLLHYSTDYEAKRLMEADKRVIEAIKCSFGDSAYLADGKLNRDYLSSIIFNNNLKRNELNMIVHPAVAADFKQFVAVNSGSDIVIESAILFESGFDKLVDVTIAVSADISSRISRVMVRDSVSQKEVERRIASQINDLERNALATYIINNNDNCLVIPQLLRILK